MKFIQKWKAPNNNNDNNKNNSWKRRKDYTPTALSRVWCGWPMERDRGSRSRSPLHKDNWTLAKMHSVCADGHLSTLPQCLSPLCLPSPPAPRSHKLSQRWEMRDEGLPLTFLRKKEHRLGHALHMYMCPSGFQVILQSFPKLYAHLFPAFPFKLCLYYCLPQLLPSTT